MGSPFSGVGIAEAEYGVAAVPELSTWMMMIFGLGAIGATLRRSPARWAPA